MQVGVERVHAIQNSSGIAARPDMADPGVGRNHHIESRQRGIGPKSGTFEELQPDCGDGFVNLRVDKKRKTLLSTYWGMNGPDQCITRFTKRKT